MPQRKRFLFYVSLDIYRKRSASLALTNGGNMLLEWKKSGRSVCGKYQANRAAAYYLGESHNEKLADVAECAGD